MAVIDMSPMEHLLVYLLNAAESEDPIRRAFEAAGVITIEDLFELTKADLNAMSWTDPPNGGEPHTLTLSQVNKIRAVILWCLAQPTRDDATILTLTSDAFTTYRRESATAIATPANHVHAHTPSTTRTVTMHTPTNRVSPYTRDGKTDNNVDDNPNTRTLEEDFDISMSDGNPGATTTAVNTSPGDTTDLTTTDPAPIEPAAQTLTGTDTTGIALGATDQFSDAADPDPPALIAIPTTRTTDTPLTDRKLKDPPTPTDPLEHVLAFVLKAAGTDDPSREALRVAGVADIDDLAELTKEELLGLAWKNPDGTTQALSLSQANRIRAVASWLQHQDPRDDETLMKLYPGDPHRPPSILDNRSWIPYL